MTSASPEMQVWEAATPSTRSQLCRDLPNPDHPTEREIHDVYRAFIDVLDGDLGSALHFAQAYDTPVGDSGGGDFGVRTHS